MIRLQMLGLSALLALTCLGESKVMVLPSRHHADEFDGALGEIGVRKTQLTYDQFRNGSAFKDVGKHAIVAVPPLFNYQQEFTKMPTNAAKQVFARLRDWLKEGGVLFVPDACYHNWMMNDWLKMVDPEFVMPSDRECNYAAPAALTEAGRAFGPCEISAGLSWGHLSLGAPEKWTVLATCGHGAGTVATRRYGKGLVLFTALRQNYDAYFRNLLRWQFREKNGREPTEADGKEFAAVPRLPAPPDVKAAVASVGGRTEVTVDPANLAAMTPVDVIAGVQRLVGSLSVAHPGQTIVLHAIEAGEDREQKRLARLVNREIARLADGSRVAWFGPGVQGEDDKSHSRILHEGYGNYNWWMDRLVRNRREIRACGGQFDLVLLGDSITEGWEGNGIQQLKELRREFSVLSAGYSGDMVPTLRWRVENGELDGFEAKAIAIMIGTNDAQWRKGLTPKELADEIRTLVKIVRKKQPKAKILLSSIFPRGEKPDDPWRLKVAAVNKELAGVDAELKIAFTTFAEQFVSPDGTIAKSLMRDFLHPGKDGYIAWKNELIPFLREATGKTPRTAVAAPWSKYPDCWQKKRHEERLAQIAAAKGAIDIVFAGDSITHFWERSGSNVMARIQKEYSVLNAGFSGDLVQELLWRLENGELDGYKTKLVMVMIGTNNAHLDCPGDIALGVRKVLDTIAAKQPEAKILLLPIFPRGDHDDWLRPPVTAVNAIIRDYADGERIFFADIYDRFLDEKGNVNWVMPDSLHPNERGYTIWYDAVKPYFEKFAR